MPGHLRATVPQFTVADLVRTTEHYRDVFGFRIAGYWWKDPPVFAIVQRDDVEIFFNQAVPGTTPRSGRAPEAYDLYIHAEGIDALAAELRVRGADILEEPTEREYRMRELVVRDCNGLVLAFAERIPQSPDVGELER